ncbi:hypothetical protein GJ700_32870 [Duganella sp. FT92W]|uniref:Uncharacterized protein n=1 Tax=Pseudoduganella rivuli TaxID=2666085 RepID=A0A7X2LVA1_9BURK|nr:hypothetical protein [Pseudoduganella rivuli]MRV76515.1 hypothetical protein [Pseudoduganella rivuli]
MPDHLTFRRIVRASAIYDLVVTMPFATPWTFAAAHALLSEINARLGGAPLPAFEPFHILMACLMGSVVMVWSVLRIRDPQPLYGRYDAVARLLFATWMGWTWLQTGAPLLWLFLVPEAAWCVVQALPVRAAGTAGGKMDRVAA